MADIVYLAPGESMPNLDDGDRWLVIEADNGKFYGSGGSWKPTGEGVGYGSLAEDDVLLEAALAAAKKWAAKYDVPTVWVQLSP